MFAASKTAAVASAANYVESVFSTYLYTGNGSTQTITNGIDLSGKGGLVWTKSRSNATGNQLAYKDGSSYYRLSSNSTNAAAGDDIVFNTNGYNTAGNSNTDVNTYTYASWTFRKQAKFFDVVTYTGNGVAGRTVAHSLGSVPGCIIVKSTSNANNWAVYHRSTGNTQWLQLNATDAAAALTGAWNNTTPDASVFTVGNSTATNQNGTTYVAYLFAHDAGGFGAAGTDNVISCGSYTGSGGTTTPLQVTLGYEPQWVLVKPSSGVGNWAIADNMRGMTRASTGESLFSELQPNTSASEATGNYGPAPTATGFAVSGTGFPNVSGTTYIYIAIRRGPMKTPTSGTSVFSPITTNTTAGTKQTTNFPIDLQINRYRRTATTGSAAGTFAIDRLRGVSTNSTAVAQGLQTNNATAENDYPADLSLFWDSVGFQVTSLADLESSVWWSFRRAPGFFDVVCYTGTGTTGVTVSHNLGVAPELIITKIRNFTGEDWIVSYNNGSSIVGGYLNSTAAFANSSTAPSTDLNNFTSTTYNRNTANRRVNGAYNYVAYLFATLAGVSKVGSYTGNGSSQTINCGFAAGARFVMIKRTDSTGDWYVWDTARGMVAGNDPHLSLNTTAAEVTTDDSVDTDNSGFIVNQLAATNVNVSSATYIFLAIA